MTRGVVLLVATFRLLVLLAFIRQLKSGCCRVRYIPLDRVLRVPPAVYCGRSTGDLSGRRTLHSMAGAQRSHTEDTPPHDRKT